MKQATTEYKSEILQQNQLFYDCEHFEISLPERQEGNVFAGYPADFENPPVCAPCRLAAQVS